MNMFVLDNDITKNAQMHCNTHTIKMPSEIMQGLCTTMNMFGSSAPMKSTHQNHPSIVWMRKSKQNFQYAMDLCLALCKEYTHRYGKVHKIEAVDLPQVIMPDLPEIGLTDFPQVMDEQYQCNNAITAYRNYYMGDKLSQTGWRWEYKNRETPYWAK